VVVRIRAVCVHPADVAATTGEIPRGPVPPPFLPGWDIAGEVASIGPGTAVKALRIGMHTLLDDLGITTTTHAA
jgi:NADPH:quinone reductase-like Zn-dependent oxidoreductase